MPLAFTSTPSSQAAVTSSGAAAGTVAVCTNATVVTGTALTQILVETSLVDSISAARRAIKEGGVYLNNQKVEDEAAEITDFIHGQFAILRRGKKTLAGIIKA